MAFSATLNFTGAPDFGLIHIDPAETAKAFQSYLDTASKLTGVALSDVNTSVSELPEDTKTVTLFELISKGMKLFDAVVWLHAGRPKEKPLVLDPTMTKENIPSAHEVARAVFYVYFMLLTQARYPAGRASKEKPKIPNFLRTIMGMENEQHYYVELICSFEPQKFDPAWAQFVSFDGFGPQVLSRFGLGVAGYRMFSPFGLYEPKEDMAEKLQPAFAFARALSKASVSWNIHPLTRNPNILKSRGNLNKNLGNLILDCFSDDQIQEMVTSKVLFKKPEREAGHRNYLTWEAVDDISGNKNIFK